MQVMLNTQRGGAGCKIWRMRTRSKQLRGAVGGGYKHLWDVDIRLGLEGCMQGWHTAALTCTPHAICSYLRLVLSLDNASTCLVEHVTKLECCSCGLPDFDGN